MCQASDVLRRAGVSAAPSTTVGPTRGPFVSDVNERLSGDTGPCDNLVRLAQGADYLVHEVIDVGFIADRVSKLPNRDNIIKHLTESHTSPEAAGLIARRAGVNTLVLSHLVPGDGEIAEDTWQARAGAEFDGNVVCGVDLDQFALTRS